MREIKFRAWDKEGKGMLYGVDLRYSGQGELESIRHDDLASDGEPESSNPNWEGCSDIDDFDLMQFTGLKDKNGKEIYEGDIVKTDVDEVLIHEVFYRTEVCAFELRRPNKNWLYSFGIPDYNVEIIGNIYENPELLRGE